MLTNERGKGIRHNETTGLWAVHCSMPQFWAWKHWMETELGYSRTVHSKWLTVWGEWPPTTSAAACRVAQQLSDLRDEIGDSRPVPRRPEPWDGAGVIVPEEYREVPI